MLKISDYPETTSPNKSSMFLVQTQDGTKQISYENLMKNLKGEIQNGSD